MEEMFRPKLPLTRPSDPLRSAHPLPARGARGNGERAAHPFSPSERGEGGGSRMRGYYNLGGTF
ncbi:hypothetical protein FHW37_103548 [Neorhizobium alkalisoli]|uniref:Uncharacterized protein n=1 Tax=Neorhizobium alkalisoli TaxID=528178 RepID=A0A561QWE4_9HYPH|nr:hypothetical protein FHW37_103548 [Neorhizobium alkalisoli]